MPTPGDVVYVPFFGADGDEASACRRGVESDLYHSWRPDIIVGVLTTQLRQGDRADRLCAARLGSRRPWTIRPSVFALLPHDVRREQGAIYQIGVLSARDWAEVQVRLRLALAV